MPEPAKLPEFPRNHPPDDGPSLSDAIDRFFAVARRRRWWVLLPACGVALAAAVVVSVLPSVYRSEATLVIEEQVPQRYVTPDRAADRESLQFLPQRVLSRPRLLEVSEEFSLYPAGQGGVAGQDIAELVRRRITIEPYETRAGRGGSGEAFRIGFEAASPELAQKVTSKLASLFIEENVRARGRQAAMTMSFVQGQVDSSEARVKELEERLRGLKQQHLGQLPEQQSANMTLLIGLQGQLQNTLAALGRARGQHAALRTAIANELARLQADREALLRRLTPRHSQVLSLDQKIAALNSLLGTVTAAGAGGNGGAAAAPKSLPPTGAEDGAVAQLRGQVEANLAEIEALAGDEKRLKTAVAQYQGRLNAAPVREQQLSEVMREYDLAKQEYAELANKKMEAELAASMERQQQGRVFRMLEAPGLPLAPVTPKRLHFTLGGWAGGLLLGVVLAFFIDQRDRTVRSENDLGRHSLFPLVVSVPLMLTPAEEKARRRRGVLEWAGASILLAAVGLAQFFFFFHHR